MTKSLPDESVVAVVGSRRTRIVWMSLLAAMTSVGGLLLATEGNPAPSVEGVALAAPVAAAGATPIQTIFSTRTPIDDQQWLGIVIHHSASPFGSARTLAKRHRQRGLQGLGHHFVIGNGRGADDGELFIGYRWLDQLPGAHTAGPDQDRYNRRYIGVCLIGDGDRKPFTDAQMRRLTQLVNTLRRRLNLPLDQVLLHSEIASTTSPGRLFPSPQAFRQMLEDEADRAN